jgi:hypothetical protein
LSAGLKQRAAWPLLVADEKRLTAAGATPAAVVVFSCQRKRDCAGADTQSANGLSKNVSRRQVRIPCGSLTEGNVFRQI